MIDGNFDKWFRSNNILKNACKNIPFILYEEKNNHEVIEIVNYIFDEDLMNGDDLYRRKKLVINESIISMLVKILYKIGESKGLLFYVLNDLIEF